MLRCTLCVYSNKVKEDGWIGDTALIGKKCLQDFGWENVL